MSILIGYQYPTREELPSARGFCEWAIDPDTRDAIRPVRLVYGAEAIRIRLAHRMRFWYGENFLDTREGMRYREFVLVRSPDRRVVKHLFRRCILSTRGIASVDRLDLTIDNATRHGLITFEALCVTGATLVANREPFIVPSDTRYQ